MFGNMASFFTKKVYVDEEDERKGTMMDEMVKLDNLYVP